MRDSFQNGRRKGEGNRHGGQGYRVQVHRGHRPRGRGQFDPRYARVDPVLEDLVDQHADVVRQQLDQQFVELGQLVLREQVLPQLPLDGRVRGFLVLAQVVRGVELLAAQLELIELLVWGVRGEG